MHLPLWFILVVIYEIKHFIADFPLQGRYMLGKFRPDWGFVLPLLAHVGVHACGTFLITIFLVSWKTALCLALFDGTAHFIMDRIKAGPKYLGRYKALTAETFKTATPKQIKGNTFFWWSLGLDQGFHNFTHATIILWCLTHLGQ